LEDNLYFRRCAATPYSKTLVAIGFNDGQTPNRLFMHKDIDDYEPDMEAYYRMSPDERRLRSQKYYWCMKYHEGKISYDRYIRELEDFYEVLDNEDRNEIKKYKDKQAANLKIERQKKNAELYQRQKEKEKIGKVIGYVFIISIVLAVVIGLLSRLD
jgi:hypothetical protein